MTPGYTGVLPRPGVSADVLRRNGQRIREQTLPLYRCMEKNALLE
jgi:hypothetical protein